MTTSELYLLYTLQFDLDSQAVFLRGALLAQGGGLRFVLGSELPFSLGPLGDDTPTTEIVNPLGMTGVALHDLAMSGGFYQEKDARGVARTRVDMTLGARATFTSLPGFSLGGALVFEDKSPRLALLSMSAETPLTLTKLVKSILGGALAWADEITDEFELRGGSIYFLRPPDGSQDPYTYTYKPKADSTPLVCKPGFNVQGSLRVFGRADLDVTISATKVRGSYEFDLDAVQDTIAFPFVTLVNPAIHISTRRSQTRLALTTGVTVLGTALTLEAAYDSAQKGFAAIVAHQGLRVHLVWRRGGVHITRIEGLPSTELPIDAILKSLNTGFDCDTIVKPWLKKLRESKLTPSLAGSPTLRDDGKMNVPLNLKYSVNRLDKELASATIRFDVVVEVPSSLEGLPAALAGSLVASMETIATRVLQDPSTYKAIALAAADEGGASALARFICRVLATSAVALAKDLANEAKNVRADSLAATIELANVLMRVALLGLNEVVAGLVAFFAAAWEAIKKLFGDNSKREQAQREVALARGKVEAQIGEIDRQIDSLKTRIAIGKFETSLNENGVTAAIELKSGAVLSPSETVTASYTLLTGEPGDEAGVVAVLPPAEANLAATTAWSNLLQPDDYRMNAVAHTVLRGFPGLDAAAHASLTSAIRSLEGVDDASTRDFANYLRARLGDFEGYATDGIKSAPAYATPGSPTEMTVGRSYLGMNTRLSP